MKLQELAHKLGCRLEGKPAIEITGVAGIDHAAEGQLTFLANRRYSPLLKSTQSIRGVGGRRRGIEARGWTCASGGVAYTESVSGIRARAGTFL